MVCNYLGLLTAGRAELPAVNFPGLRARLQQGLEDNPLATRARRFGDEEIRRLLQEHFVRRFEEESGGEGGGGAAPSFSTVHVFVNVLGSQLETLFCSPYFDVWEAGDSFDPGKPQLRHSVVTALVETARRFAFCSVARVHAGQRRAQQRGSATAAAAAAADEEEEGAEAAQLERLMMGGIVRWASADHFMSFLEADSGALVSLYRAVARVPAAVAQAVRAADRRGLIDYQSADPDLLFERLCSLVQSSASSAGRVAMLPEGYVLTPDNLLKMAMIHLRLVAGVPVVIMGETGCGKTSLVKSLALASGVSDDRFLCAASLPLLAASARCLCSLPLLAHAFVSASRREPSPRPPPEWAPAAHSTAASVAPHQITMYTRVKNFHAGVTEEDVLAFLETCVAVAEVDPEERVYVFLDEVRRNGLSH